MVEFPLPDRPHLLNLFVIHCWYWQQMFGGIVTVIKYSIIFFIFLWIILHSRQCHVNGRWLGELDILQAQSSFDTLNVSFLLCMSADGLQQKGAGDCVEREASE